MCFRKNGINLIVAHPNSLTMFSAYPFKIESTQAAIPFFYHPSPAFWDNLSTVHLTKSALKELSRRNVLNSVEETHLVNIGSIVPVQEYLITCDTKTVKLLVFRSTGWSGYVRSSKG